MTYVFPCGRIEAREYEIKRKQKKISSPILEFFTYFIV